MGTLSLLPVLIIFLIFQKYIVQGLRAEGLHKLLSFAER
jgi:multiple sugar transport system permease protein